VFTFTDSEERIYPNIILDGAVLVAQPGQSYDLDADPGDGRWSAQAAPAPAPETAPEAPVADATPESTPTPSN
jgi:hypothetical protein